MLNRVLCGLGIILWAAALSSGCNDDHSAAEKPIPDSSCVWVGPYGKDNPDTNFGYPDTGAAYWTATYSLPEGATLRVHGEFPYARYMNLTVYDPDTVAVTSLSDFRISPDPGSSNPFLPGAERLNRSRHFTLQVLPGTPPDQPPPNTLYDGAASGERTTLALRVFVPDLDQDLTGGVGLPRFELILASGETVLGNEVCDVLQPDTDVVQTPTIPPETYAQLRNDFSPAKDPPLWAANYGFSFLLRCAYAGNCEDTPARGDVSFYANVDSNYINTFLDRQIAPVAVTRVKIPSVPPTLEGDDTFDPDRNAQLRYWSMCINSFYSQQVTDCLYDQQLQPDSDGFYTIVASAERDRPVNATPDCGVGYLQWPSEGDGFAIVDGQENDLDSAWLLMRNMLVTEGFTNAIQFTTTFGDEADVLGEFLPVTQYMTKEEFEALGCPS